MWLLFSLQKVPLTTNLHLNSSLTKQTYYSQKPSTKHLHTWQQNWWITTGGSFAIKPNEHPIRQMGKMPSPRNYWSQLKQANTLRVEATGASVERQVMVLQPLVDHKTYYRTQLPTTKRIGKQQRGRRLGPYSTFINCILIPFCYSI